MTPAVSTKRQRQKASPVSSGALPSYQQSLQELFTLCLSDSNTYQQWKDYKQANRQGCKYKGNDETLNNLGWRFVFFACRVYAEPELVGQLDADQLDS